MNGLKLYDFLEKFTLNMCGPMGLRGTQVAHLVLDPRGTQRVNYHIVYSSG